MAYIYCIKNDVNDKFYIGKTIYAIEYRFKQHIRDAYNHKCNSKLHKAILKYGEEHFYIVLLEECLEEQAGEREKYYIQLYDSVKNGYNISYGGDGESQVDFNEIEKLFLQGYNFKEIAERTGHTQKTIAYEIIDSKGRKNGEGITYITHQVPFCTMNVNTGDTIDINIKHNMQDNMLPGITDVGVLIENNDD